MVAARELVAGRYYSPVSYGYGSVDFVPVNYNPDKPPSFPVYQAVFHDGEIILKEQVYDR